MKKPISFTFTVLRYVHDIATGEFLNVGVVVYAPEAHYLKARMRTTYGRLTKVFPDANGEAFKRFMAHLESAISSAAARLDDLFPESGSSAIDFAARVLPRDDSSLQWSPLGSGRTTNPENELDVLFERMVSRHDFTSRERRDDEEVWKSFSRSLQKRNLLPILQSKEIVGRVDSVTFDHAFKNGLWHCLKPISFDLIDPESIHQKALRWVGQMTVLHGPATEPFKLYLLIGEPRHPHVFASYAKALAMLQEIPGDKTLYTEAQAEDLSLLVERESHSQILSNWSSLTGGKLNYSPASSPLINYDPKESDDS